MEAVSNLNREDAMEEALSHTTQYNPFEMPVQEVNSQNTKEKKSDKKTIIFIAFIFVLLVLFIIFLPQISKLFAL